MNPIQIVLFDLGGVILEIDWPRTVAMLGLSLRDGQGSLSWIRSHKGHDAFERGLMHESQFFTELAEEIGFKASVETCIKAWNSMIKGPIPGIDDLVKEVAKTHAVHALSNTNPTHAAAEFSKFEVFQHFKSILTSFDLKARKPEPEIYQKTLKILGVPAQNVLFIDDLEENVEAARRAGFKAEKTKGSAAETRSLLVKHGVLPKK